MKNYRYDMIGAFLEHNIQMHPQEDMKRLGFKLLKSEPVSIADCWWFRVENEIENVPDYLDELSEDFKFSDERN